MWEKLCEPTHLFIAIVALIVALIATAAGKGIGSLLGPLFKRLLGKEEVNIIVGGEPDMATGKKRSACETCQLGDIPKNCPFHEAEHERSKRNEGEIEKLWTFYGKLGDEMRAGFQSVNTQISKSQETILGNQRAILEALRKHREGGG